MYPADEAALGAAVEYAYGSAVAGDVVEFGCLSGRTASILAREIARMEASYGKDSDRQHGIGERSLWLFDSFAGFPETTSEVDAAAPHIRAGVWHAGTPTGGSPEAVRKVCEAYLPAHRIVVMPGWFKEMLGRIPEGRRFAMVHMDCDYYSSTYEVLDHLLTRNLLSNGCAILFDDWLCNQGDPRFGQQRAWREIWSSYQRPYGSPMMSFSDLGPYNGMIGHQFIIHRDDGQ